MLEKKKKLLTKVHAEIGHCMGFAAIIIGYYSLCWRTEWQLSENLV